MWIKRCIQGQTRRVFERMSLWRLSRQLPRRALTPRTWSESLADPTAYYADSVRYFYHGLPRELRAHRAYFHIGRRGFGEHAFHVLWHLLLERIEPSNFLEIGVYRGQVISLVAYWAKLRGKPCEVYGISPFSSAGDTVSTYAGGVDYYQDTLANFAHFGLPEPNLLRAYSTDQSALELIRSRQWDMIYIDGNHDYAVAKADWEACSASLRPGGVIVLDDAALTTAYEPPLFASKGHPGPSRVAEEIDARNFREILQVGHNRAFQKIGKQ